MEIIRGKFYKIPILWPLLIFFIDEQMGYIYGEMKLIFVTI